MSSTIPHGVSARSDLTFREGSARAVRFDVAPTFQPARAEFGLYDDDEEEEDSDEGFDEFTPEEYRPTTVGPAGEMAGHLQPPSLRLSQPFPMMGFPYPSDPYAIGSANSDANFVPGVSHYMNPQGAALQSFTPHFDPYPQPEAASYATFAPMPLYAPPVAPAGNHLPQLPPMGHMGPNVPLGFGLPQQIPLGPQAYQMGSHHFTYPSGNGPMRPGQRNFRKPTLRRPLRPRRTDQGPEPSNADIYPDDAIPSIKPGNGAARRRSNGMPLVSESDYNNHFIIPDKANRAIPIKAPRNMSSPLKTQLQREALQVNNPLSWPTPAEVYSEEKVAGKPVGEAVGNAVGGPTVGAVVSTPIEAVGGIRLEAAAGAEIGAGIAQPEERHVPPTKEDINSAFDDVLELMNALPHVSQELLSRFGPDNEELQCEEAPMHQTQLDGSRYGMRFAGVAIGDDWIGAPAPRDTLTWPN